jgi:hypothetical protein
MKRALALVGATGAASALTAAAIVLPSRGSSAPSPRSADAVQVRAAHARAEARAQTIAARAARAHAAKMQGCHRSLSATDV